MMVFWQDLSHLQYAVISQEQLTVGTTLPPNADGNISCGILTYHLK